MQYPRIYAIAEDALTVELGNQIDPTINRRVIALQQSLLRDPFPGMTDLVPAYCTLTVFYHPLNAELASRGKLVYEYVSGLVSDRLQALQQLQPEQAGILDIPVCYHPTMAPDLSWVSEFTGLAADEVVRLHCSLTYRVYMIGFVPGFPYLGATDPRLDLPRKPSPVLRVAPGSVGLAGRQTGIYPFETPGGWQVIGRTPYILFDPARQQPFLFQVGMSVRFYAVDLIKFQQLSRYGYPDH